jgi:hypothetical protein
LIARSRLTGTVAAAGVVHLTLLVLRLARYLPDWAWPVWDPAKPPGSLLLIAGLAALTAAAVWLVSLRRAPAPIALAMIVVLAIALQYGLAATEGGGLRALRDRMVDSGHAEFADVAVSPGIDAWSVATRYEDLIDQRRLGVYARSKPPGQLLLYVATERLAQRIMPRVNEAGRLKALRALASFTWPAVAALAVIPLYFYALPLAGPSAARAAALWYALVPAVLLITLHTDQAFFPLLGAAFVALTAAALRRDHALSLVLAGLSFAGLLWFTFGFLALAVYAAVLTAGTRTPSGARPSLRTFARRSGLMVVGSGIGMALFRLVLHYDAWIRYQKAVAFHTSWGQRVTWDLAHRAYFGTLNVLEYAVWIGLPVTLLVLLGSVRAVRDLVRGDRGELAVHGAALVATVLFLAFFGKTPGETARLWMFLTPMALGVAAAGLWRQPEPLAARTTMIVAALQALICYATKLFMDFR